MRYGGQRHIDYAILDAPAGIHGAELTALVRRAQTILIPVLLSATDMRATARFVRDLLLVGKVSRKETGWPPFEESPRTRAFFIKRIVLPQNILPACLPPVLALR